MMETLNILEKYLDARKLLYVRLDGSLSIERRQILTEKFNSDSRIFCCLMSTRAGWNGIHLRGVDTVVLYDSDWNPTFEAQVAEKCRRNGLQGQTRVYRLVGEDTVEENIYKKGSMKSLYLEVLSVADVNDISQVFFKSKTLSEIFTDTTIDFSNVPSNEKKQKLKSQKLKFLGSSQGPAKASSNHVLPVIFESLKDLEAAEDVRAGEVTQAELASRLSEFSHGFYALEPNLLGALRNNETSYREAPPIICIRREVWDFNAVLL
jgi:SNF2 family DNA or RNA helicase